MCFCVWRNKRKEKRPHPVYKWKQTSLASCSNVRLVIRLPRGVKVLDNYSRKTRVQFRYRCVVHVCLCNLSRSVTAQKTLPPSSVHTFYPNKLSDLYLSTSAVFIFNFPGTKEAKERKNSSNVQSTVGLFWPFCLYSFCVCVCVLEKNIV